MTHTADDRIKILAGILPAWVKQFDGNPTKEKFSDNYTKELNFFSERDNFRFYLAPDCYVELINMRIEPGSGKLTAGSWQVARGAPSRHTVMTFLNESETNTFYDRTLTESETTTTIDETEMENEFSVGIRAMLRLGNETTLAGAEIEATSEYMGSFRRLDRAETQEHSSDIQRLTFVCPPHRSLQVSRQESPATATRTLEMDGKMDCDFRLRSGDAMDLTITGGINGMTRFLHGYGHDNVTGAGSDKWIEHAARWQRFPWQVNAYGITSQADIVSAQQLDSHHITEKSSSVQYSDYELKEIAI